MKLIKCEKGHFYDGDMYLKCPYCFDINEHPEIIRTMPAAEGEASPGGDIAEASISRTEIRYEKNNPPREYLLNDSNKNQNGKKPYMDEQSLYTNNSQEKFRINWRAGISCVIMWIFMTALPAMVPFFVFCCVRIAYGLDIDISLTTTVEFCAFTLSVTISNWSDGRNLIEQKKIPESTSYVFYTETIFFVVFYGIVSTINVGQSAGAIIKVSTESVKCMYIACVFITGMICMTSIGVQFIKGGIMKHGYYH